eukprot:TRINITY_DN56990_c0_g1_i1.p1 TRINITY_DN56990_c0_g1~~TRINITY_DN56990_c0_g1_i1.p1  ORF type:complete len:325 (-),score=56.17 TRINITY_DN56990_c0_g1_i1:159-1133(-)
MLARQLLHSSPYFPCTLHRLRRQLPVNCATGIAAKMTVVFRGFGDIRAATKQAAALAALESLQQQRVPGNDGGAKGYDEDTDNTTAEFAEHGYHQKCTPSGLVSEPKVLEAACAVATRANFTRIYEREEWGVEARSGFGSREDTTRELRSFLECFLRERRIHSIVDAGCGHWPTGYQRFMNWHGVHYTGVDVVPFVVEENRRFLADVPTRQQSGLASATILIGDVASPLPPADLLLVKDVLMHLPNEAIQAFIRNNLDKATPRYKAVLLVQNDVPFNLRTIMDIEPGQLLPFDITQPPFSAPFRTVCQWRSDEPKAVQLWELKP